MAVSFRKTLDDYSFEAWRAVESGQSLHDFAAEGWEMVSVIPERWVFDDKKKQYSVVICTIFFKRPKQR